MYWLCRINTWIFLYVRPANERRRYIVTSSLIGWAQTWNYPWKRSLSSTRKAFNYTLVWKKVYFHFLLKFSTTRVNSSRPRQNRRHFADDVFKCNFFNENVWIPIQISLKFVPKGPMNNIPALVQIMGWRRPGDKPLSEPMIARLPTLICVNRPQWVNMYDVPWLLLSQTAMVSLPCCTM